VAEWYSHHVNFLALGGYTSFSKNIEHKPNWIGNFYEQKLPIQVTIQEPIVVKQKSYKALSKANAILINGNWQPVEGDVLLYFKKDSSIPKLGYGNQIIITSNLAPIINAETQVALIMLGIRLFKIYIIKHF
jgi:hypothetical protein